LCDPRESLPFGQDEAPARRLHDWQVADAGAGPTPTSAPNRTEVAPERADRAQSDNGALAQSEDEAFQQEMKDADAGKVAAQIGVGMQRLQARLRGRRVEDGRRALCIRQSRPMAQSKCLNRQEFVVVGWSDPEGSRPHLGALLLGY
jgi:hypothetical protein